MDSYDLFLEKLSRVDTIKDSEKVFAIYRAHSLGNRLSRYLNSILNLKDNGLRETLTKIYYENKDKGIM
jgi:hypothetical protein